MEDFIITSIPVTGPLPSIPEIDNAIDAHTQAIYRLRRLRNLHARPNCLPDEILAQVLWWCLPIRKGWNRAELRGLHSEVSWTEKGGVDLQQFLRVTTTCHRWRAVSAAVSNLWTLVPCHTPACTAAMLEKAKHAPLTVRTRRMSSSTGPGAHNTIDHHAHELALANFPRLRSLRVWVNPEYREQYQLHLGTAARVLENITLGFDSPSSRLPDALFANNVPHLRHITLHNAVVDPGWPPLTQLQTLRIQNDYSEELGHRMCSVLTILEVLRSMPHLRTLELVLAISGEHFTREAPQPPATIPRISPPSAALVELPHLVRLCLSDTEPIVVFLVQHLTAPKLDDLYLVGGYPAFFDVEGILGLQLVRAYLDRPRNYSPCVLLSGSPTQLISDTEFHLGAYNMWALPGDTGLNPAQYDGARFELTMSASFQPGRRLDDADLPRAAALVWQTIGKLRPRQLRVSCPLLPPPDGDTWISCFQECSDVLTYIEIDNAPTSGFIAALGHTYAPEPGAPDDICYMFGRLEQLVLRHANFRPKIRVGSTSLLNHFKRTLRARARDGLNDDFVITLHEPHGFRRHDATQIEQRGWAEAVSLVIDEKHRDLDRFFARFHNSDSGSDSENEQGSELENSE